MKIYIFFLIWKDDHFKLSEKYLKAQPYKNSPRANNITTQKNQEVWFKMLKISGWWEFDYFHFPQFFEK